MANCKEKTCPKSTSSLSTKELARSLGLLTKLSSSSKKSKKKKQPFHYLVVIDFESTCWKDKRMAYAPEVIEFPAVLLNTSTGLIESEFHHYVQPSEHQKLSEFCKELTGITQEQVDGGIPIGTCLMLFSRWLKEISEQRKIQFLFDVLKPSDPSLSHDAVKWCTFVTWSDWDIGICLKKECDRKRHRVPTSLRAWIDLRATYKTFYSRKPNGLAGAMKDLGLQFAGRQHSGLDDARNTAKLSWRMIQDGCVMNITSSIDTNVAMLHQIIRNGFKRIEPIKNGETSTNSTNHKPLNQEQIKSLSASSTSNNKQSTIKHMGSKTLTRGMSSDVTDSSVNNSKSCTHECTYSTTIQSLVSPLVSVADCNNWQSTDGATTLVAPATILSHNIVKTNLANPILESSGTSRILQQDSRIWPNQYRSLSKIGQSAFKTAGFNKRTLGLTSSMKCPSPLNLAGQSSKVSALKRPFKGFNLAPADVDKTPRLVDCTNLMTRKPANVHNGHSSSENTSLKRPCKGSNLAADMRNFKIPRLTDCTNLMSSKTFDATTTFMQCSKSGHKYEHCGKDSVTPKSTHSMIKSSLFKTPLNNCVKPSTKFSVTPLGNATQSLCYNTGSVTLTSKFGVTPVNKKTPSVCYSAGGVTPYSSKFCVTPLSNGTPLLRFNSGSVTPPLCDCGRRSRRLTVGKAGPNQGRVFYTCPVKNTRSSFGKSTASLTKSKTGCKFFCWEPS